MDSKPDPNGIEIPLQNVTFLFRVLIYIYMHIYTTVASECHKQALSSSLAGAAHGGGTALGPGEAFATAGRHTPRGAADVNAKRGVRGEG